MLKAFDTTHHSVLVFFLIFLRKSTFSLKLYNISNFLARIKNNRPSDDLISSDCNMESLFIVKQSGIFRSYQRFRYSIRYSLFNYSRTLLRIFPQFDASYCKYSVFKFYYSYFWFWHCIPERWWFSNSCVAVLLFDSISITYHISLLFSFSAKISCCFK